MAEKKKSAAKLLQEKITAAPKHAGIKLPEEEIKKAYEYCEEYKKFLDSAKTEREAGGFAVKAAAAKGFKPFDKSKKYKAGDKVYVQNRSKSVILAVIGTKPLDTGANILAAHIDAPRVDLKQHPLYEEREIAYFKTHYYGGIKKYQWTAIPLSLHGVVIKKDGTTAEVKIGEESSDPVFVFSDLLPHLSGEQNKRTLAEGIKGEELNLIIGSMPFRDDEISNKVKLNIMNILFEKYGIIEDDFISAELEIVPQFAARDVGFDRSLVGAYGQDDRVCAYTCLTAALELKKPERTAICVLADKEEVGSDGNTGLKSAFLKYFIYDLAQTMNVNPRTVMERSECLSADVNAAFDPTFPDVVEKGNASYINYGLVMTKYTGSRGKAGTSDASAEFTGKVRSVFENAGVIFQTGELGKVDFGGGGTVAAYLANLGMDVIDIGVPVLSMHSPFELTAKTDVYEAYKGFKAFLV
ncbi:MAG: aminopeptidase [Ruminococcus sp.]|jgi:aspartyl aminopeptidase|nr:aminopeptidase [Ruminococcus sp.]